MNYLFVFFVVFFFISIPAFGQYTTKDNGVGCISKGYIETFRDIAYTKDYEAANKLIDGTRCAWLKPGIRVTIKDSSIWSSVVEVRPEGQTGTIWTLRSYLMGK